MLFQLTEIIKGQGYKVLSCLVKCFVPFPDPWHIKSPKSRSKGNHVMPAEEIKKPPRFIITTYGHTPRLPTGFFLYTWSWGNVTQTFTSSLWGLMHLALPTSIRIPVQSLNIRQKHKQLFWVCFFKNDICIKILKRKRQMIQRRSGIRKLQLEFSWYITTVNFFLLFAFWRNTL